MTSDLPRASRSEFRALLRLALPIAAGQLAAMGMPVIDTLLAGHLGPRVLGAAAIGGSLFVIPLVAVLGVMMSLQPIVSELDGAGRRSEVGGVLPQAVMLGLAAGIAAGLALGFGGPAMLRLVGAAPVLRPAAASFLHAVAFALPAVGVFGAARGLSEGLSRTVPTMLLQAAGLVLLAPLGWALMYGRLGAPALGVLGSGIATALVSSLQAVAYVLYVRFSGAYRGVDWGRGRWRPDPAILRRLLRLGVPIAASFLLEAGMFSAAGLLVARLGPVAAAANQVALNIVSVTFMVPLGVALAATVRVGNAVGGRETAALRRTARAGFLLVAAAECLSATTLLLFPGPLIAAYTDDPDVARQAAAVLRWGALFQLSDGGQVFANGMLRGLKDTRVPMGIIGICYWGVGLPLGAWLALARGLGAPGLWIGLFAGLTLAAMLLGARVSRLVWRFEASAEAVAA